MPVNESGVDLIYVLSWVLEPECWVGGQHQIRGQQCPSEGRDEVATTTTRQDSPRNQQEANTQCYYGYTGVASLFHSDECFYEVVSKVHNILWLLRNFNTLKV